MVNWFRMVLICAIIAYSSAFYQFCSARGLGRGQMTMAGKKLLLVQNKGGGHGEIGYSLCKALKIKGEYEITLLQDDTCNKLESPFSSYDELLSDGVKIIYGPISDHSMTSLDVDGGNFDFVVDNWSKSREDFHFVKSLLPSANTLKQYLFISSAGMYKTVDGVQPHIETDAVKDSNGPRTVELACMEAGLPYTFMRPQYIYGPKSNKKYLDYFIGRALRKLPIPIPMSGEQLLGVTHIDDVCSMIALAIGNDAALNEIFNCGTDIYLSYIGLCSIIHDACGNSAEDMKYFFYDPKDFDTFTKNDPVFPFRRETFITNIDKIKTKLKWKSSHTLAGDIADLVAQYKAAGGMEQEWDEKELICDLQIIASKDHSFMFTYPFFDDTQINPESMPYSFESAQPAEKR
jgi:hypothetical protein